MEAPSKQQPDFSGDRNSAAGQCQLGRVLRAWSAEKGQD